MLAIQFTMPEWNFSLTPFIIGALFGMALFLGGLADPDKIIGTLRLKDLHAMRTIFVFVLVGMLGTWILKLTGHANLDIKPATIATIVIGGALLGVGFGMTGYCPGTGLACAAAGRFDALITVLGMFAGAAGFIWIYPMIVEPINSLAQYDLGKITITEYFGVEENRFVQYGLVPTIFVVGMLVLFLTRPREERPAPDYAPRMPVRPQPTVEASPKPRQVEITPQQEIPSAKDEPWEIDEGEDLPDVQDEETL
ncbi:MAG: YeeE/YedE family protein [Sedimentisphaerales bacterium]|nr:YeeE/YedE family protein [Sedimentisphaerales bacterium]